MKLLHVQPRQCRQLSMPTSVTWHSCSVCRENFRKEIFVGLHLENNAQLVCMTTLSILSLRQNSYQTGSLSCRLRS